MKKLLLYTIILSSIIVGCSDKEGVVFDWTLANDGFQGITYTGSDGVILGPTDPDDWRLFSGSPTFLIFKENINELSTDNIDIIIPVSFHLHPAYPNPSNSEIVLSFDLPVYSPWRITIIDDNYNTIRMFEDNSEAGTIVVTWDGKDQSGRRMSGDIYRVVYEFYSGGSGLWGYGDIWMTN
ncbi:MAG: hypothetical protein AB1746_15540 [Candidatus Zixiibacteriota bacterium]